MVTAYPVDADFGAALGAPGGEFLAGLEASDHEGTGAAKACVTGVRMPGGFAPRAAQQGPGEAMPAVRTRVMERFPGPWWGRHRRGIAMAVGGGLAVAPMAGLARLFIARLREPPG